MILTILWIANIFLYAFAIYIILKRIKNLNKLVRKEVLKIVKRIENEKI